MKIELSQLGQAVKQQLLLLTHHFTLPVGFLLLNHMQIPRAALSAVGSCLVSSVGKPSHIDQPSSKPGPAHASSCRMAGFPPRTSQNLFDSPFKG